MRKIGLDPIPAQKLDCPHEIEPKIAAAVDRRMKAAVGDRLYILAAGASCR